MAIIKFTKLQRENRIVYKYGEFSFIVTPDQCAMDGLMTTDGAMHGDRELHTMAETAALAMVEFRGKWAHHPPLKRGAGTHPKAGPYVAYTAPGLVIKITGEETVLQAKAFPLYEELPSLLISLNQDREEIRAERLLLRRAAK